MRDAGLYGRRAKKVRQDFRAWRQHTGIAAPAHNNMYAQQPGAVRVESFILAMTFGYGGKRRVLIPAAAHTFERYGAFLNETLHPAKGT